ncbi:MAG: hypothetical protein JWN72_2337 [Thermoleophilia bacterium]|nr:hypothetical protein [Thermoleophilia bacterium]
MAGALPSGPPSAESLRALLTPGLEPAELAIARIVQASSPAAAAANANGSTANSAAIRNYVSAQVSGALALDQVTTATEQARATVAAPLPTSSTSTSELEAGANASAARNGLAGAATQAAVRGQAAAIVAGAASPTDIAAGRAGAAGAPPALVLEDAPQAASTAAQAQASSAKANATASAATGAAHAVATPTGEQVAKAVADLGALAARVATEAPVTGAVSGAAADAAKNANATQVAQNRGADGSAGAAQASNAGTAASGGGVAATVTALREFLASPQAQGDSAKLMQAVQAAPQGALQAAIRQLPESQSLQLAGALLDQLPASDTLAGSRLASLRAGVHEALRDLGRALQPPADHDVATLRHVLHQVATTDPRPSVAHDAAQLLQAKDAQQIMSRTQTGADPGYLYIQVPLPDGRVAEVMVRRDASRRDVSFEEFNIAFLLNTERLGTLMIQLDAQPTGIRADIKTDAAGLGDLLEVHAEALAEPLAAAARRPVTVTTGLFDGETPSTLLEEPSFAPVPGDTAIYA